MRVCIDIEANSLSKPSKIWCIVAKDIDTNLISIFRNLHEDKEEKRRFLDYASKVTLWIGHNILGYDYPVLASICGLSVPAISTISVDTLIVSKLVDYSREGHSIEAYGEEFGLEKIKFNDFTQWSQELEDYCVRDVEICLKIYNKYLRIISDCAWKPALDLEHSFQLIVNELHDNGFCFNTDSATRLLGRVTKELDILDKDILVAFPPKEVLIKEFTPKQTKFGTISRTSVPRVLHPNIHLYIAGETYQHTRLVPFNPSSHKQIIEVLSEAGWSPVDKTDTHIDTERELKRLKYSNKERKPVDLTTLSVKLKTLEKFGWRVNEQNLTTLPDTAPAPARLLAKRILLEARRRSLTEWLNLVQDDGRIHGKYYGIGAWSQRMAHQQPNTANIPSSQNIDGSAKLLGKEMRSLWCAPKKRLLVGVDAEGIQLRIFAHYINDAEFIEALVRGKKDDKTDPHSLNQRVLGNVCKSRQAAKRFIYALLLGAGIWKLSQILGCSDAETREALDRLMERYQGFRELKENSIPLDARRGWFTGLDGRKVSIPGETIGERKHLCMSGYLQNGEAIVIKRAAVGLHKEINRSSEIVGWKFINIVHDEFISEVPNDMKIALQVAQIKADAIKKAGEELKLRCPLAGSYYNEDIKDYTIGTNWYQTH